jgi:cysteine synthase A
MRITNSVLELIGNTPLIRLNRVTKGLAADVLAKCEFMNPSGSVKDRMTLRMIGQAEKEGKLKPGSTIVESTTGNTGTSLALVGGVKGYKVQMYIPEQWGPGGFDPDFRIRIMKCFGAEIKKVPLKYSVELKGAEGASGGIIELGGRKICYDLEKTDPKVWWARQGFNTFNTAAHKESTGKEIVEQTDGKVDAWVASIGTGGTLLGVAEALKEVNPNVKIVGVEPEATPLMEWEKSQQMQRYLEEIGLPRIHSIIDTILEKGIMDEIVRVDDADARNIANRLCREEGLFCGMSSGANVFASLKIAKKMRKGQNIVTVLVDRRDRYLGEFPEEHYVT